MARRVTEGEKKEILKSYHDGLTIKEISINFKFTETTIKRQLKTFLTKEELENRNCLEIFKKEKKVLLEKKEKDVNKSKNSDQNNSLAIELPGILHDFYEIAPLEIENQLEEQKDLSSIQISDFNFPKMAYMIVDKSIELEIKKLKDYPDWQFLSQDELSRNTIEIFVDLKVAKRLCRNEQKVIKVPNTNVFKIAASLLLSKGISRIISDKSLIAL